MPATASDSEAVRTALERSRGIPEETSESRPKPLSAFPTATPPASKPFRLHPEWAQRGPFW